MLFVLAMLVARNTFRDYKTVDEVLDLEPPEGEGFLIFRWDPSVEDQPFFEASSGDIETASAIGRYLKELGIRANYVNPPTFHDFRAEGLTLTGIF
jgi:hypothetical protein